jgi:hypothetical protein
MENNQNNELFREQNYREYTKYWINFVKRYILISIIVLVIVSLFSKNYINILGLLLIFVGLISSDLIGIKFKIRTYKSIKSASYSSGKSTIYWNIFSIICKFVLFIFLFQIYIIK